MRPWTPKIPVDSPGQSAPIAGAQDDPRLNPWSVVTRGERRGCAAGVVGTNHGLPSTGGLVVDLPATEVSRLVTLRPRLSGVIEKQVLK